MCVILLPSSGRIFCMVELRTTGDGSATFYHPEIGEHYHSRHGALQESKHVFLEYGLKKYLSLNPSNTVSILEMGFGTGLNFLLSADFASEQSIVLQYEAIEAYPLSVEQLAQTGYEQYVQQKTIWEDLLSSYRPDQAQKWKVKEHDLQVHKVDLFAFQTGRLFDVLYFDAFSATHQPELWTEPALAHLCQYIRPGGIFVTYSVTGNLKRSLKALNFEVFKAPGPPGKREMLYAVKSS